MSTAIGVTMPYELEFAGSPSGGVYSCGSTWTGAGECCGRWRSSRSSAEVSRHAALGLVGWDDSLRAVSPRLWRALRAPFAPLERVRRAASGGTLRTSALDASVRSRRAAPVRTAGDHGNRAADLAAVGCLEPEIVVFISILQAATRSGESSAARTRNSMN